MHFISTRFTQPTEFGKRPLFFFFLVDPAFCSVYPAERPISSQKEELIPGDGFSSPCGHGNIWVFIIFLLGETRSCNLARFVDPEPGSVANIGNMVPASALVSRSRGSIGSQDF